jgi:hypothetical protein
MNLPKFLTPNRKTNGTEWPPKDSQFAAERREHPRHKLELPIDYSLMDGQERWGIAGDASEGGLLVYLHELIEKRSILKLEIFFPWGSELSAIKAMAKVVWSDSVARKVLGEYRHGLAFQAFQKESLDKLRTLIRETSEFNTAQTI